MFDLAVVLLHETEVQDFLLVCLRAEVVTRRNLDDFVHTGIVVDVIGNFMEPLEVLVQDAGVEGEVYGGLAIDPVSVQVFKLWEYLLHLPLEHVDLLIEELLDAVATKVEEHGDLLQLLGTSGLVNVDNIGENVEQVQNDVGADSPIFDLFQEVAEHSQLVVVEHQFLDCAP